ncbi:hypothetical protein L1987_58614 [Smallanthus sonchifolius]|uniref:Uncharacterized protein n=1 Tax=Smallanthus sonchifolius TaxID=185202 RepID=A0ACB9DG47_9ASTR|nr:hypothetical protein L1987_58614 [Smallanthus sonchifolius]
MMIVVVPGGDGGGDFRRSWVGDTVVLGALWKFTIGTWNQDLRGCHWAGVVICGGGGGLRESVVRVV